MPLKLVLNRCVSMGLVLLSGVAPATIAWSQFNATESVIDNDLIFQEQNGVVAVEAEHFVSQNAEGPRQWHITTHDHTPSVAADGDPNHAATASGGAYIELLPDTRRTHGDKLIPGKNFQPQPGPIGAINYRIQFNNAGRYYVWVRAFSGGSEDNGIHVGLNGKWPKSGQRMQWCEGKHAWRWESKQRTKDQHCGVPGNIFLDIDKPGTHTVSFCMREDGFEFDRFLLTKDKNFVRPADAGPATRTTTGATPPSFAAQPQPDGNGEVTISGELKTWHKITFHLLEKSARRKIHFWTTALAASLLTSVTRPTIIARPPTTFPVTSPQTVTPPKPHRPRAPRGVANLHPTGRALGNTA